MASSLCQSSLCVLSAVSVLSLALNVVGPWLNTICYTAADLLFLYISYFTYKEDSAVIYGLYGFPCAIMVLTAAANIDPTALVTGWSSPSLWSFWNAVLWTHKCCIYTFTLVFSVWRVNLLYKCKGVFHINNLDSLSNWSVFYGLDHPNQGSSSSNNLSTVTSSVDHGAQPLRLSYSGSHINVADLSSSSTSVETMSRLTTPGAIEST